MSSSISDTAIELRFMNGGDVWLFKSFYLDWREFEFQGESSKCTRPSTEVFEGISIDSISDAYSSYKIVVNLKIQSS